METWSRNSIVTALIIFAIIALSESTSMSTGEHILVCEASDLEFNCTNHLIKLYKCCENDSCSIEDIPSCNCHLNIPPCNCHLNIPPCNCHLDIPSCNCHLNIPSCCQLESTFAAVSTTVPNTTVTVTVHETSTLAPTVCSTSTKYTTMSLAVTSTPSPGNQQSQSEGNCESKVAALGVLTAIMAILLTGTILGWVCTSVRKRLTAKRVNSDSEGIENPLYDPVAGTQQDGTDDRERGPSSQDPAYELVSANRNSEYDVINRGGAPRPHPPMVPSESRDPAVRQSYSLLQYTEGDRVSQEAAVVSMTDDQVLYNNLEVPLHRSLEGDTEPADYEVPQN